MKRLIVFSFLCFSISISSFAQSIIENNIYFDSDVYVLDDESKKSIQSLQNDLSAFNESSLQIVGHTDQDGSDSYNIELSKKRAEEVKNFLIKNGYPASEIEVSFRGESDLANQASDAISKQQNRRVSIVAEGYSYNSVAELVTQIEAEANDEFIIDQNIESNLTLTQGTEVRIPVNAFCHLDGTPLETGEVEMTFKEAFEYLDMVDEGLFTQTQDQILETGGMIYIEASQNGQPLRLQDGKKIEMLFPEQEEKDGMELFTGAEDEDGIIWDATGEEITSKKGKSEAPFIQVDLSPLLDFEFADQESESLEFAPMPKYPKPARISYPPFKGNYTEEGYAEALKKYNAVMEAHAKDKIDRPARLKEWTIEANRRKDILFAHKKRYIASGVRQKIESNLALLKKDQDRISHDRLINVLFGFMDDEVGKVEYDEWYYVKKTFGSTVVDAREEIGLDFPQYDKYSAIHFYPQLNRAIIEVSQRITEKKFEMGYVDEEVLSRYVVATSNLGWINCDRFYEFSENQRTDLQFATANESDQFYLVFKNMRSLLRPNSSAGKVVFEGVPKGEEVRLVVVRMDEGEAKMAQQDFKIGSMQNSNLLFASAGIKDLKRALAEI